MQRGAARIARARHTMPSSANAGRQACQTSTASWLQGQLLQRWCRGVAFRVRDCCCNRWPDPSFFCFSACEGLLFVRHRLSAARVATASSVRIAMGAAG
eukprot:15448105-Alexandrium_andersonii.AAC.1